MDPKDKIKLISTAYKGFHNSKHTAESTNPCIALYVPPCRATYPANIPIIAARNTGGLQPTIVQYKSIILVVTKNSVLLDLQNDFTIVEIIKNNSAICDPDTDKICIIPVSLNNLTVTSGNVAYCPPKTRDAPKVAIDGSKCSSNCLAIQ